MTRKKKTRGFEEDISAQWNFTLTGGNDTLTFDFTGVDDDYLYTLYFDDASGDSNLKLHTEGIEAGDSVVVDSIPTSTATAPANIKVDGTVSVLHPVFVVSTQALAWIGLQDLKVITTSEAADKSDPLGQKSTIGYKFMAKAAILDQTRLLRAEIPSAYS